MDLTNTEIVHQELFHLFKTHLDLDSFACMFDRTLDNSFFYVDNKMVLHLNHIDNTMSITSCKAYALSLFNRIEIPEKSS